MKMKKVDKQAAQEWLAKAVAKGVVVNGLPAAGAGTAREFLFPESVSTARLDSLAMAKLGGSPADPCLVVFGPNRCGFSGTLIKTGGHPVRFCALDRHNANKLRRALPSTAPSRLGGEPVTIGLGDRLGLASPGHLRLVARRAAAPVLAQQSVRELNLTNRTYEDVLDSATWAVFQEGYRRPWGADGDHLKSEDWVKKAVKLGYSMITADVSDGIHKEFDGAPEKQVLGAYASLPEARRREMEGRYLSLSVTLDTGEKVSFDKTELARIVLIYLDAMDAAERLYRAGVKAGRGAARFDFELSIDETAAPTLPAAHVFCATEMAQRKITLFSMAPRFIGEFQKGIDYIGDPKAFEKSFATHAAIARHFGYRISVHSGSDKFTVFPVVGRETRGFYHLKTAGTNWLQALEVICEKKQDFFRELYAYSLKTFPDARKYYHITPDMKNVPPAEGLKDPAALLANSDTRQVLHVTYGEILRNPDLNRRIYAVLRENIEAYWKSVERHIGRHLDTLGVAAR
jgi:tagaturonate epimerase